MRWTQRNNTRTMIRTIRTTALSALFVAATGLTSAQQNVDIGLYQNNGMLEVKVRPEADFNGIFSSLVFTIRWDSNSSASLGNADQDEDVASYMSVDRSGNIRENGGARYAVYAGFGMRAMSNAGVNWQAGQEYTVLRIPVTGQGEFELVNDAYTADRQNNANFYVSLGGTDRTGVIYKGLAPASEDGNVLVQPNPNNGRFTLSFTNTEKGDVTVEVINSIGQSVYNETVRDLEGNYKREMDLSTMGAGAYYVKLKRNGNTTSHKVIYR